LKFQLLAISLLFFNLLRFQRKFLKFTQFIDPITESSTDFFQNFSPISIPKNEAGKVKKRDLRIFQVEKHAI